MSEMEKPVNVAKFSVQISYMKSEGRDLPI